MNIEYCQPLPLRIAADPVDARVITAGLVATSLSLIGFGVLGWWRFRQPVIGSVWQGLMWAVGLVVLHLLAAWLLQTIYRDSRTEYYCDDVGIRRVSPGSARSVLWSAMGAMRLECGWLRGRCVVLCGHDGTVCMRIPRLDDLPRGGAPLFAALERHLAHLLAAGAASFADGGQTLRWGGGNARIDGAELVIRKRGREQRLSLGDIERVVWLRPPQDPVAAGCLRLTAAVDDVLTEIDIPDVDPQSWYFAHALTVLCRLPGNRRREAPATARLPRRVTSSPACLS